MANGGMGPLDWLQDFLQPTGQNFLQPTGQNSSMYGQNEGHESHTQAVFAEAARVAQEEHEAYLRLQQARSQPQPEQAYHQNRFADSNGSVYGQNQFTGSNSLDRYNENFLPSQFPYHSPYAPPYGPPVDDFTNQHYVRPSDINPSPVYNHPNVSRQAHAAPSFNPMTTQRQARPASEQRRSIDVQSAQPSQETQRNSLPPQRMQPAMSPRSEATNHQTDIRSRPEQSSGGSTQQKSASPSSQHKQRAFLDPAMTSELFPTTSPGTNPYTSAARSTLASRPPPASRTPTPGTQSPGPSVAKSQHQRPSNSAARQTWNGPTSSGVTSTSTPSASGPPGSSNASRPSPAPNTMVQRQQQPVSQVSASTEAQKPAYATQNAQDGIPRRPDGPKQPTDIPKSAAPTVQPNPVPNRSIVSSSGPIQETRRPGAAWKVKKYVPNTSLNPPSVPRASDAPSRVSSSGVQVPTSTPGPQVPTPRSGPPAPPSSSVPTGPRLDSLNNSSVDRQTLPIPASSSRLLPAQQMPWHRPAPPGTMPNGLPAPKKRLLDNGTAQNVNTGVTSFHAEKYLHGSPSRNHIGLRPDLVLPIDKKDAAEKESYDPATIARDVLISASRHPTERGLNEHLDPLRKSTAAVETNADLDTFRWDIVDPRDPRHRPPTTGPKASASRDLGAGAAAAPVQQSPRAPPAVRSPPFHSPGPYHAHPPSSHFPLSPPSHLPSRPPRPVHAGTPTDLPTPPANQSTKSPSKPPVPKQPSIPPTPSSKRSTPQQTQPSPHSRKYPEPQVVIPSPSKMPRPRKSVGRPRKEDQAKVAPPQPPTEYQVFHCKWTSCPAELHNLEALQTHILKAHIPNDLNCGWAGCKNTTSMAAALLWKHVQEAHIRPIVWTLGDGPKVSAPAKENDALLSLPSISLFSRSARPPTLVLPVDEDMFKAFSRSRHINNKKEQAEAVRDGGCHWKEEVGPNLDPGDRKLGTSARIASAQHQEVAFTVE